MPIRTLDYVLWWAMPVMMSLVTLGMLRRSLNRDYPYFFNYAIFSVLSFAIEFPLHTWANYFYVYWTLSALSAAVSFAVLLEIFKDAFRPYEALRDLSVILFRWCALVVLLVAGMWAVTSWRSNGIDNVTNTIYLVSRCIRMMQCALVFFMLLFSDYLHLSRRNFVFGISVGFGFWSAVNMLVFTSLAQHSAFSKSFLSRLNSFAYVITMLIWLGYTWLPSTVRSSLPRAVTVRSQEWDMVLEDARHPAPAVSLLDSMDKTVERLLYNEATQTEVATPSRH